jgi:2-methylcitrate dehydratase PrpD
MASQLTPVSDSVIEFLTTARTRVYPAEVIAAARKCLVDWAGVAIGAASEEPGKILSDAMHEPGAAILLSGGTASSTTAALINGTLAHTLDFDDTHVASLTHISGPTWAATLALASRVGDDNGDLLGAFISGFEVGGRLGRIVGPALLERGVHATAVIGGLAATAAGCALLGLDETQTANAMGLAATQAGGLTISFGTMAKPFHAGKAAMNAVIAVQLARAGFTASHEALDNSKGLAAALIQDRSQSFCPLTSERWQILENTFKPYASCLLTHASIDCARDLSGAAKASLIERVVANVHPLAIELAGKTQPRTPLEAKFSIAFCIALGLKGYTASAVDFSSDRLQDAEIQQIAGRISLKADPSLRETAARISLTTSNGSRHDAETAFALGNPENPMRWADMKAKFIALTERHLGASADAMFELLRTLERASDLGAVARYCTTVSGAAKAPGQPGMRNTT